MDDRSVLSVASNHETLLESLAGLPDELERLLVGRSVETLRRPASDGGWGAIENLCHLRDWEEILLERVRAVVERDRPDLPAYDDELWAIERDYRGQEPQRVVQRFRMLRGELIAILAALPPEGWRRVGRHAIHGDVDLDWLAERARLHGEAHVVQVREALS